jgi:hypothetical protein
MSNPSSTVDRLAYGESGQRLAQRRSQQHRAARQPADHLGAAMGDDLVGTQHMSPYRDRSEPQRDVS